MRRPRPAISGFTTLELLVAAAVFSVILVALTSYFASSTQARRLNEALSDRQQEVEAAINVLAYDLRLAGYKGTTPSDVSRSFGQSSLEVEQGVGPSSSDRLIIRYFEDAERLFGGENTCGDPCVVTYEVDEADGELNLFRREGSNPERGIVQRVDHFRVLQYILRNGNFDDVELHSNAPSDVAGLNIEIAFSTGGLWRFPVGISNAQE